MPAVIVGITNGDKIICSKYEGRSFKQYALIAGFAEIGETIEETVHREVMEEVGLKVKNLRYYKSQPSSLRISCTSSGVIHSSSVMASLLTSIAISPEPIPSISLFI